MEPAITKAQLLDELQQERAQFEALLTAIGPARMTQPDVAGGWSIKDIVAHLTGWQRRTVARFRAARSGDTVPPPPWPPELQTDDDINAWIYAANRDRPLDDVLSDSRATFQQLVDALSAFDEAELRDSSRFGWLEGDRFQGASLFGHFHEEHEPDMRAWLDRVRRSSNANDGDNQTAEDTFTLTMFYTQWQAYQEHIKEAVAPLTAAQLTLRAAPDLRSIGENVAHIIGCRIGWFTETLGEDGGEAVKAWEEQRDATHTASELAQALDVTWHVMAGCLDRWSPADMQQTFPDDWDGEIVQLSRAWVVWHVLEHDLHHGGEVALTLGMHGLKSGFTS